MFHPQEKTPSSKIEARSRGTRENSGRETPREKLETPYFPRIPPHPEDHASRPRQDGFPRLLLRFGRRYIFFRGGHRGLLCRAGAWRGHAATDGRVALRGASVLPGILKLKQAYIWYRVVVKSRTRDHHYLIVYIMRARNNRSEMNPFRTPVPFWDHGTQTPSNLSPIIVPKTRLQS